MCTQPGIAPSLEGQCGTCVQTEPGFGPVPLRGHLAWKKQTLTFRVRLMGNLCTVKPLSENKLFLSSADSIDLWAGTRGSSAGCVHVTLMGHVTHAISVREREMFLSSPVVFYCGPFPHAHTHAHTHTHTPQRTACHAWWSLDTSFCMFGHLCLNNQTHHTLKLRNLSLFKLQN